MPVEKALTLRCSWQAKMRLWSAAGSLFIAAAVREIWWKQTATGASVVLTAGSLFVAAAVRDIWMKQEAIVEV